LPNVASKIIYPCKTQFLTETDAEIGHTYEKRNSLHILAIGLVSNKTSIIY